MRQITTTLYKFNELSPDAQRRAWENDPWGGDFDGSDYIATLKAFENIFDIGVWDYRVGDCIYSPYFKYIKSGAMSEAPEGDALRLARYIWNNYAEYIQKGKYYSKGGYIDGKYTYKCRYSNCTFGMDNCPLTGFCADYDILQPIIDCLEYKRFYTDVDDLLNDCLTGFFNAWDAEIEYHNSFEYFAEMAEINDLEFYETGEIF